MSQKPSLSRSLTTFDSELRGQKRPPTDRVPEPETKKRRIQPLSRAATVPIKQTEDRIGSNSQQTQTLSQSKPEKITLHGNDKSPSVLIRKKITKNNQEIQIRKGDLTKEHTVCIVNAANSYLAHGAGVAGAIRRAGGRKIEQESDEWVRMNGTVPTGQVAWTEAGNMPSKYCIHAVGPIYSGGGHNEAGLLKDVTLNSFLLAEEKGWESLAIPAISSGIFGFPKDSCAQIMISTAIEFYRERPKSLLRFIRFTNFDSPTVNVFCTEFDRILSELSETEEAEDSSHQDSEEQAPEEKTPIEESEPNQNEPMLESIATEQMIQVDPQQTEAPFPNTSEGAQLGSLEIAL